MAPLADHLGALLGERQSSNSCPSGTYYSRGNCYSSWSYYGRWILASVVIAVLFLIFFLYACINSRRRRRRGAAPMYGTGWMAPGGQHNYNNPQAYQSQPPAYGAPQGQSYPLQDQYTGNTFNRDDGYYGQHEGVQPPKNAHSNGNAGNDIYAAPEGPPPGKVVR